MSGEIIRLGDPTSHGGTVLEGSPSDICHGKPIAYVGHQTSCPRCRGTYPIIEGALTTTFYGKGVALAGMKTACGATLLATQFSDTVEYGHGSASDTAVSTDLAAALLPSEKGPSESIQKRQAGISSQAVSGGPFDLFFLVQDETGEILAGVPYKIFLEDGSELIGITDYAGHSGKVSADYAQEATIEVPYYDDRDPDSSCQSDTCAC